VNCHDVEMPGFCAKIFKGLTKKSYNQYMINPASFFGDFPEEPESEISSLIAYLRAKDREIRNEETTIRRPVISEKQYPPGPSKANRTVAEKPQHNEAKGTPVNSPRVTFRLDEALLHELMAQSRTIQVSTSSLVRKAIMTFLENLKSGGGKEGSNGTILPEEVNSRAPRYLASSGTLKKELRRQFMETLAAASVAARLFPRTDYLQKAFWDLLAAYRHFQDEKNV